MPARVRILGADGKPATRILKDEPIRIEVIHDTPSTGGAPEPTEVVFGQAGGWTTDAMKVAWDGRVSDSQTRFVTDALTIEGGGRGGGRINIGGFEWSTGDFKGLSTGVENEVSVSIPGEGMASVQVFASNAYRSHSILSEQAQHLEIAARRAAVNLRDLLDTIATIEADPPADLDAEKLARTKADAATRLAHAELWLCLATQAQAYLVNDQLATPQQNAAALYMLQGARGLGSDPGAVDLAGVQGAITAAKWEIWDGPLLDGITELAVNGYRGITNATGAAQLMTLFGPTDEMGKAVTWDKRALAFLDLVAQAGLMGANMKFQLDHLVSSKQPPASAWGPGNRPRFDGPDATKAPTAMAVDPGDMGMTPQAVKAAHLTARQHDVTIEVRPTNPYAKHWRDEGLLPKPETFKPKTVNEIDQLLGADPMAPPGRVALFEPKPDFIANELRRGGMSDGAIDEAFDRLRAAAAKQTKAADLPIPELPPDSSVPAGLWRKVAERFAQRAEEFAGPTGDKVRALVDKGALRVEDGLLVDAPSGKQFAGDHDLWDIKKRDGSPLSEVERSKIVQQLADNEFMAQHPAHVWWDPQPHQFADPRAYAANRKIYEDIIEGHRSKVGPDGQQRGEVLISFGPEGPPTAVYSGETLPQYLGAYATRYAAPVPGSPLRVPSELVWWGVGGASTPQPVQTDASLVDWANLDLVVRTVVDVPCSHCIDTPVVAVAASTPWKKIAAGVAAAVVAIGVAVGIAVSRSDSPAPAADISVAETPLVAIGGDPVTTTAAAPTTAPTTTTAIAVPSGFALVSTCPVVTHSPPPLFPASFSFILDHLLVVPLDAPFEDGTEIDFQVPGSDAGHYVAPVGPAGLVDVLIPISSMTNYSVVDATVRTPSGEFPLLGEHPAMQVGPPEGPLGGCVPPGDLSTAERQALVDQAGDDHGGAPFGGGGPAVIPADPIPAPEDDLGPYREFLGRFDAAHRERDVDTLFDLLHPATVGRYGDAQCRQYLDGVAGSVSDLQLLDARTEPWDYPTDDRTTPVPDAVTVDLTLRPQGGDPLTTQMHLAVSDDALRWFTDCGDPLN